MPKDARTKSSRSMAGSLQLAKEYTDNGDIRRVRLPEDKLKDQFRLSFPERYLDRLSFDKSETFDKRLMQYRLSYLDSRSTSRAGSMHQSHRTASCSTINSKSSNVKSNSKASTPTSKSPRRSLGKSQQKTASRSSSKAKEPDVSQKQERSVSPTSSPRESKGEIASQASVPQSPQRQEGLTPPASKQPSRQGSPKPHISGSMATSVSLPSTNSYLAYKKAIMQNVTSAHGANVKRPSSTRSNYNSLEYKQNLLLDHENDTHERALKQTNNHVVMDMLATDLAMAYVEDNCRDHKVFRNRHDIWEDQRDYAKPWRHNMKLESNEGDAETYTKKNIIINEPVKALVSDANQPREKGLADNCGTAPETQAASVDLLKKYGKNDTQQLYDYSEEADPSDGAGRSREDGSFIKRYSIQTIQWNRQYNSMASYKQELDEAACQEGVLNTVQRPCARSPQQRRQSNSLTKPETLSEQLERYHIPSDDKAPTVIGHASGSGAAFSEAAAHTIPEAPQRPWKPDHRPSATTDSRSRSGNKAHTSISNKEACQGAEEAHSHISTQRENADNKSNRESSNATRGRRPQSARPKPAVSIEKSVKLPSSSITKEKRPTSAKKDNAKRAGSRQYQLKNRVEQDGGKPNNDTLDIRVSATSRQSATALGTSAPEVDIHKSFGLTVTTLGPVAQQRHVSDTEESQPVSKSTLPISPTRGSTQQTPSITISEKSPEIREYTSHVQPYQQPMIDDSSSRLQQQVELPTTLSPILFPHNLETTPHIRTSGGEKSEPHGRILNDLAADLQELVTNKKRKTRKLPASIVDPKDVFPLSPAGAGRLSKDFSIDAFDKLPLLAADLNDSGPTALPSSPSRRMTEASNRNITKIYLHTAVHSPQAPIVDSSMLQEPKKAHAYAMPSQLLAIHDNTAEGDALVRSQELSLSRERSDLLSSVIQRTLGAQVETSLPVNEELQTQLYNALTKNMNKQGPH